MLATYVPRMHNENLEIKIAGSSPRPQVHGRFLSCLSNLVPIKCKLPERHQKEGKERKENGRGVAFPLSFPFGFPPFPFPFHACHTVRLLIGTWSPHHQTILLPTKLPSRIELISLALFLTFMIGSFLTVTFFSYL